MMGEGASIPSAVELVESFRQQVERTLEHAEKRLAGAKAELEFAMKQHRQALLLKKSLDNALVENVMEQDDDHPNASRDAMRRNG